MTGRVKEYIMRCIFLTNKGILGRRRVQNLSGGVNVELPLFSIPSVVFIDVLEQFFMRSYSNLLNTICITLGVASVIADISRCVPLHINRCANPWALGGLSIGFLEMRLLR